MAAREIGSGEVGGVSPVEGASSEGSESVLLLGTSADSEDSRSDQSELVASDCRKRDEEATDDVDARELKQHGRRRS